MTHLLGFGYSFSQKLYYHDTYHGGVTGGSYNPTWNTSNPGTIELNIDGESTIRKAFLFIGVYGEPLSYTMLVNDTEIILSNDHLVSEPFSFQLTNTYSLRTAVLDITTLVISNQISLVPPTNQPFATVGGRWVQFYVLVLYANPNMPETTVAVFINESDCNGIMEYEINDINPMSLNNDVSLIINSEHICNNDWDGSEIFVDNNSIGVIGGIDVNSNIACAGVSGSFYYQNNTLFGLGDDVANNTVDGPDAIANIQENIELSTNFDLNFTYQSLNDPPNPFAPLSNVIWQFYLVYTSTCEDIDVSLLTSDTTTCAFVPVQLGASGGNTSGAFQAYEWLPQQNLSCYDCPDPVFTGNTTTNYTVRIRNTDSCSVVYPVRVRVLPNPSFESIEITESVCGGATGSIAVASSGLSQPHSYVINDGVPQNNGTFNNLASGAYTITLTNDHGCSVDSTVVVGEFNNVQAAFSVNPTTGAAPLDISITNQSQNATEYFWDFSNQDGALIYEGSGSLSGVEAPLAGVYTLTLVAGNGTPHCNDTTSLQIFVYDSLQLVIPNVFTPNSDGTNDWFGITSNIPISGKIVLLNRWGNVVQEKSFTTQANSFEPLWNGMDASEGVYFYRIFEIRGEAGEGLVLDKEAEFQGFVHLVR